MIRSTKTGGLLVLAMLVATAAAPPPRAPEKILPNDNRQPAGTLANGVLTVKLETRQGRWFPEGEQGRALDVAAWAEEGKSASAPGPLIRVPVGTRVRATLRNTFDKPLIVFGFGKTRGASDSVSVPARGTRDVEFQANVPGTFYYFARRSTQIFDARREEDLQLSGAIVVDPPGARLHDRIFVLSFSYVIDTTSPDWLSRATMVINGLSWPHTERLDLVQHDSVHWRVLNLTEIDHPMHLHGFYFRVESKGNGVADSLYTPAQQRLGVTEIAPPFGTMTLSWVPSRPGNWIYHCHFADHISHHSSLDAEHGVLQQGAVEHHASDRPHQMFGLVLGLRVAPKGPQPVASEAPRAIRLFVRDKPNVYGKKTGYAFVLGGTPAEKDRNAMPVPGPTLVLDRGKPVAITVINQAKDRASVHWHGIELDSYPDGVPGWSGQGKEILPSIAAGDSLTVRFTPPRAGTFMYHSHFNESEQIASGMYAPIIVVEPGQTLDAERDRVLFFGTAGSSTNVVVGPFAEHLLNGQARPSPMDMKAGTTYRLRLFNLADGGPTVVSLLAGKEPVAWRAVAKDGAALPASQAISRPARLVFEPGEIYDFDFTPAKAGKLSLIFGPPPLPPGPPPASFKLPPNLPPPPPIKTMVVNVR
jgi:FtsP/CotA-like multicopper oxidase with cupredoxin domain